MNATRLALLVALVALPGLALAAEGTDALWRVLSLRDHNTRVVLAGVGLLGAAAGVAGSFLVLRKRALLSDAVSHATLPGIVLAYMAATLMGGDGKALPLLLAGGAATGVLGMLAVAAIARTTRLRDDAALGIVLSVFFGVGIALLTMAGRMGRGESAGLMSFVYGKTASMVAQDAWLIAAGGAAACAACVLLFKEFASLCFDEAFARSQGWPVLLLDVLLMGVVVLVTVIGLQAVGLVLVVALLVIPPSAARFWTEKLRVMTIAAAIIGAASGVVGAAASALAPRLPAGAVIVLVAAGAFFLSLVLGTERGLLARAVRHHRLTRRVERQHILRAFWEIIEARRESTPPEAAAVGEMELLARRSWSRRALGKALARARAEGLVEPAPSGAMRLTAAGVEQARRTVRNHRLWEMYLVTHADIAPSHVDRDADAIEHILDAEMIARLEALLERARQEGPVPTSPHRLSPAGGPA